MDNNLLKKIDKNSNNHLSIYITAGYPGFKECLSIIVELEKYAVSFVEIGMPYSDPLADGKTIQESSQVAIDNGMTLIKYFDLVKEVREKTEIPIVYMGYLNQILQYGVENFSKKCRESKIECLIIPDLPIEIYEKEYKTVFEKHNLLISFLITPTTSTDRIRIIEKLTTGFIYVVSSSAITGKKGSFTNKQIAYFKKIESLNLSKPYFIGFGIHDKNTFEKACKYANGAIIGSEFIRQIAKNNAFKFLTSLKTR